MKDFVRTLCIKEFAENGLNTGLANRVFQNVNKREKESEQIFSQIIQSGAILTLKFLSNTCLK